MDRIKNAFRLFGASFGVLRDHKRLAILPVISGIASLVVIGSFLVPIALTSAGDDSDGLSIAGYVLLACLYLVLAFITIFFNAALILAADQALHGAEPTIGASLRAAAGRIGTIAPWALISGTVSLLLRAVQDRVPALGQVAVSLVGLAWSLVTYLVLPLIVLEKLPLRASLRRSAQLFKQTWGEQVAAGVGIGLVTLLLALISVPAVLIGIAIGGAGLAALAALAALWLLLVVILSTTLSGIFLTALYRFATEGWTAPAFADTDLGHAFRSKR